MDDQRKNNIDAKGPKQRNRLIYSSIVKFLCEETENKIITKIWKNICHENDSAAWLIKLVYEPQMAHASHVQYSWCRYKK